MNLGTWRLLVVLACAVCAGEADAGEHDEHFSQEDFTARLQAFALLKTLNADLLSHDSATLTLENWCAAHRLASPPRVVAVRVYGAERQPTAEQRRLLGVSMTEPIRYRRVHLTCGRYVLSEADNWYVPSRLTPDMNRVLDTTDTAFGRAVLALKFRRQTLSAQLLWSPGPQDWDMDTPLPETHEAISPIPREVLRHHAVLTLPDGTPIAELIENYTNALIVPQPQPSQGAAPASPAPFTASEPSPSRLDAILARGTLRVGMPGDYFPFGLYDKASGQWQGLDVDEARAMAKALGVKLEFVQTSWPALMTDLLQDEFDIGAGGVSITLERQKTAFFSTPILQDGKTPITRCENAAKFQTLSDIDKPGVRVITPPGGTNEAFDRAHLQRATIVVEHDNTRIFDGLVAGKADVMITDATETKAQHKLHPELCSVHPDHPFDSSEKAYLLPRDPALQQWVNAFLHVQRQNGELGTTLHHWLD